MYKLAVRWTVWAPRVLEIHPQLFAGRSVRQCHVSISIRCPALQLSHAFPLPALADKKCTD
jgi:hypothetical protein